MPTTEELNDWIRAVGSQADRTAFAALFRHYAPRIKSFLMRSGTGEGMAEELVQETMVVLWRRAASFDPQRAQLSTWLFTIARNLRIDQLRRHSAGVEVDGSDGASADETPDAQQPPPDELLHAMQREQGVRAALRELPPEQSLVLRLSFFEEQPHARIAEELGIPLGTVKSRIRLAVTQLRRLLDGYRQ